MCRLKVLDFFEKYPDVENRQAVEKIDANVKWVAQHGDIIATWLYSNIDLSHTHYS